MIQAAGYHSSVTQDADLIPKPVAKYRFPLLLQAQIRPIEALSWIQPNAVGKFLPVSAFLPRIRKGLAQKLKNLLIPGIKSSIVPKTKLTKDPFG